MRFILLTLIRLYRLCISPMLPVSCRHAPTCSEFAQEALKVHGTVKGGWLALRRLLSCHPWGSFGFDPVPHPCEADVCGKAVTHE
jgi:putative membrane protein insertion efficiency factor